MDGLRVSHRIKSTFGILFAVYGSVYALCETFLAEPYYLEIGGLTLDMLDIIASSNRVLGIFLWKQAILSSWKPDEAQTISSAVKIEWVTQDQSIPEMIDLKSEGLNVVQELSSSV